MKQRPRQSTQQASNESKLSSRCCLSQVESVFRFWRKNHSDLQLQGHNAGAVPAASAWSLQRCEALCLQNIRITWDWASSNTRVVWILAGLPRNWSKLSFWVTQLLLGALSVFQGWFSCHDEPEISVWLPRLKLHSLPFLMKLLLEVFFFFFSCRKFEMTVFFLFCFSPCPRPETEQFSYLEFPII